MTVSCTSEDLTPLTNHLTPGAPNIIAILSCILEKFEGLSAQISAWDRPDEMQTATFEQMQAAMAGGAGAAAEEEEVDEEEDDDDDDLLDEDDQEKDEV